MTKKDEAVLTLRVPRQLYQEMLKVAEAERRSMNAQIVVAIEEHVERRVGGK